MNHLADVRYLADGYIRRFQRIDNMYNEKMALKKNKDIRKVAMESSFDIRREAIELAWKEHYGEQQ